MIAISGVVDSDDIMIITEGGTLIRTEASGIAIKGRYTQGVRLMRLKEGDTIAAVTRVADAESEELKRSQG